MTTFKAMTWNVENLFSPQAGEEDQGRFQQKIQSLARVIGNLAPDVVGLQEVGGEEPLQALQDALQDTYPYRAVSSFPDGRGIRVAFISKHAVREQADIVDFPPGLQVHDLTGTGDIKPVNRMGRGALRIRVTKETLTLDLICCHLKSKLLSFPRPWGTSFTPSDEDERARVAGIALMKRMAEAVTLRTRANALLEGDDRTPLILLGDLNDVPEAQTTLILAGPPGSEIRTQGFDLPDRGDKVRLFNVAPLLPTEERYSRKEHGRPELLDQIFASEDLFPFEDGHRRLPVAHVNVKFREELPSVTDDPSNRADDVAPDHAPATVSFDLPDG